MDEWLHGEPASLVEAVREAKLDAGEASPGPAHAIEAEIRRAQADLRGEVRLHPDGRVLVHRAMRLADEAVGELAPGDALGVCWAFDRRGAHAYDGRGPGAAHVASVLAEPSDIAWAHVIAMWSSGEGEARLGKRARVELVGLTGRGGALVRPDLAGCEFGTSDIIPGGPRPA